MSLINIKHFKGPKNEAKNEAKSFPDEHRMNVQSLAKEICKPVNPTLDEASSEFIQVRRKVLDWLYEVKNMLGLKVETHLQAILIFDKITCLFNYKLQSQEFQIIGVSGLLIAIKYQEVKQINFRNVVKYVVHEKFTKEDLIATEVLILRKLKFKLPKCNFTEFCESLMTFLKNMNLDIEFSSTKGKVKMAEILEKHTPIVYCFTNLYPQLISQSSSFDYYFAAVQASLNYLITTKMIKLTSKTQLKQMNKILGEFYSELNRKNSQKISQAILDLLVGESKNKTNYIKEGLKEFEF